MLFQQLQRPPFATPGWFGTGQGDQFRFGGSVEYPWSGRSRRMLAHRHSIEAFFHQLLVGSGNRVRTVIEGRCDLTVTPPVACLRRVGLQQDAGPGQQPGRVFTRVDQRVEPLPLSFTTYLFTALCFAVTMHLRVAESLIRRLTAMSMTDGTSPAP